MYGIYDLLIITNRFFLINYFTQIRDMRDLGSVALLNLSNPH